MRESEDSYFRYLAVGERDKDWGVYVTGVGCSHVPPESTYPVNVHPDSYQFAWDSGRALHDYQFVYIVQGEGEFESKTASHKAVTAGAMFLLFPDEWHRYRPTWEIGWQEYWLSFAGRHIEELVQRNFIGPAQPVLQVGVNDAILHPFLTAINRVRTEQTGYSQLIAVNVMEALATVMAVVRQQQSNRRSESLVREAKLILEQHAEKIFTMDKIAASFQISEKHFRRIFKQETGLSPYQYHLQMRIYRAKEMLLGTNLSIKEISELLHFENPFHFSNVFKLKTNLSPSEWRRGGNASTRPPRRRARPK